MKKVFLLLVVLGILAGGFHLEALKPPQPQEKTLSEPEILFEHLWEAYDRNYALFGAKGVDWDALYKIYRPQVTPSTTEDELYAIMCNMLGHLNDNHVGLMWGNRRFSAGILNELKREGFSLDLVKEKYLKKKFKQQVRDVYTYGWLNKDIGYLHFRNFGSLAQSTELIDKVVAKFKDAKGIIIDVRFNGGGDDRVGKLIADRFADRKRLYMITRIRNGKKHDDFTPPRYWYTEPDGPVQFTKPVVLLTHRFSVSAADNFALAMRVLPHVTQVGDTTSGCFADVYRDRLPNGWRFGVSYKLFTDYTGFCWEGIGVPPNLRITNSKKDIENKTDRVLELGLRLIESGALKPRPEPGSLKNIRESLAKSLELRIEKEGIDAAVKAFYNSKAGNPDSYYIDREELDMLGNRLTAAKKFNQALEIFKINAAVHPKHWAVYEDLGNVYMSLKNKKAAMENFQKALDLNPRSLPQDRMAGLAIPIRLALETKGVEGMVKKIRETRKDDKQSLGEGTINTFGYQLLGEKKIEAALAVFKLNTEFYPKAWNTFDSLAEAYMTAGKNRQAIKYYKKALELNPDSRGSKAALEKLEKK